LVRRLKLHFPDAEFFGCAGPRLQSLGVEPVIDASALSVVGLVEVVGHIPRIYGELQKLKRAATERRPDLAILTDSPDFHFPLAAHLKKIGVPVVYLVAPQVWAWRQGRVRKMRRLIDLLLCIFPFEEAWFRERGVHTAYIGHPLANRVRAGVSRGELFDQLGLSSEGPLVALLPGSRVGEIRRHTPLLVETVRRIRAAEPKSQFVMGLAPGVRGGAHTLDSTFWELISAASIHTIGGHPIAGASQEGQVRTVEAGRALTSWDLLAHADVALAASGTVTIEGALSDAPMVTFYRVNALSWFLGRRLVRVPHLSMVNLVAGKAIVPELMQDEATPERLADEALRLLRDPALRDRMRIELRRVADSLGTAVDPMETAAQKIEELLASVGKISIEEQHGA
jgi:lipid-A-disaccharide synthase